jgi:hypothetical protein
MRKLGLLWTLPICCSACATASGSCSLVPLREYSDEFTARFVEQAAMLPPMSPVAVFVVDGVALRDNVKACKGSK